MKEPPIFLIDWTSCLDFTLNELENFISNYRGKYHCIIITDHCIECSNDKIHIVHGKPSSNDFGAARAEKVVHDKIKKIIDTL